MPSATTAPLIEAVACVPAPSRPTDPDRQIGQRFPASSRFEGLDPRRRAQIVGLVGENGAPGARWSRSCSACWRPAVAGSRSWSLGCLDAGHRARGGVSYVPRHQASARHQRPASSWPRPASCPACRAGRSGARGEHLRHVGFAGRPLPADGPLVQGDTPGGPAGPGDRPHPRLLLLERPSNSLDLAGRDGMLGLIQRTGTEFGSRSSSPATCSVRSRRFRPGLVAINGGRLLRRRPWPSSPPRPDPDGRG